ncbi:hypothetical protein CP02DC14_2180, partial [Chlamydia psittaci 02DC14]
MLIISLGTKFCIPVAIITYFDCKIFDELKVIKNTSLV